MDSPDYIRFFLSLAFVVALIWLCAWLAKRSGLDKKLRGVTGAKTGRISVSEVHYLDPKRKLLLVRADASEYFILVAGDSVTVIDKLEGNHV
jgi:flagellar biogenesis protein FliO